MRSRALKLEPASRPGRFAGPTKTDTELAELAKAVGHPARAAIMRLLLGRGGCICGDIVDRLPLAQATVSQHLKVLKDAGWIVGEVDGPRICYCPDPAALAKFKALVQAM